MTFEAGVTVQGKQYLLGVVFLGQSPVQELWVGVARYPVREVSLAACTDGEPPSGYARQAVFPGDWEWLKDKEIGLALRGVQFENRGRDVWSNVEVAFIATSKDASGILLAWSLLDRPRQLLPEDTLLVPLKLSF